MADTAQQRPWLTIREAFAFEEYTGTTVVEGFAQLRDGTPTVRVCVGVMWLAHAREDPEITVEQIIDAYPNYLELLAAATEQLQVVPVDGEG